MCKKSNTKYTSKRSAIFSLQAKNNQEIATSRSFATEDEAIAGVEEARDLIATILHFKAEMEQGARFDVYRSETDQQWYFTLLDAEARSRKPNLQNEPSLASFA